MPKFSANLSMLFPEHDFLRAFRRARRALPGLVWGLPAKGQVAELLQKNNLSRSCSIFRPETGRRANAASAAYRTGSANFRTAWQGH